MHHCFFVSDLHGHIDRYKKLITLIREESPSAVFFGGDLFPSGPVFSDEGLPIQNFVLDFLVPTFEKIKKERGDAYPRIFLILGNDDGKQNEEDILQGMSLGLWQYAHARKIKLDQFDVYGYAYVPPTPFMLKDWEKYDISRFVDLGCIAPEDGWHSFPVQKNLIAHATIQQDIEKLVTSDDLSKSIFLFHTPPYQTNLDRAALDGKIIDHTQVDVHVGSIAVKQFIEKRQPYLTLHGHIHESARITGEWREQIGRTHAFSAAHGGPELALVRFELENLQNATRALI